MRKMFPVLQTALFLLTFAAPRVAVAGHSIDAGLIPAVSNANLEDAHVCPVAPTLAFTARHVVLGRGSPLLGPEPAGVVWEDATGRHGTGDPLFISDLKDLGAFRSDTPFTQTFPIAKDKPKVGDKVYIVGFDMSRKRFFQPKLIEAKILGEYGGMLYYDHTPGPGSSGSCTLNDSGEVVAINVGGAPPEGASELEDIVGVGVPIYGAWLPLDLLQEIQKEKDATSQAPSN